MLEWDFMRSLGWDPAAAPTRDWPSGLALGPLGFLMTGTFLASGVLLLAMATGRGLSARDPAGRAAAVFLGLAALSLALLALPTDPSIRAGPPTLHGHMHDAAFIGVGAAMLAALTLSGVSFLRARPWSTQGVASLLVAALVLPAFRAKGIWFLIFLLAVLAWCEMTAIDLWRSQRTAAMPVT
jgi:hypothetical protein